MIMFYWLSWIFYRTFFMFYFPMRVEGRVNLPKGPFVFASNHISFLDPTTICMAAERRMNFLARDSLFRNPLFGGYIRMLGAMPITRNSADITAIKTILRGLKKYPVVIFPEGTRIKEQRTKDVEAGIGLIAVKSGVPVVPVFLEGTDKAFGPHDKFMKPGFLTVKFGEPRTYTKADGDYQTIAQKIHTQIYQLA